MVMSLSWLVFYYIQRFRYMNAKDRLSVSTDDFFFSIMYFTKSGMIYLLFQKRLCCAAKKALSKIPVKNLKSEDKVC